MAFGVPLRAGRMRIVVTRALDQAAPLVERLEALGHEAVTCPLIEIEPVDAGVPLDLAAYDWVVVTSPNGAELLLERARRPLPRIAAIGPGTADALRRSGVEPDLVASVSTQEGLLAELPPERGRVLVAAAEDARPVLTDALDADFVPLYRTRLLAPTLPKGDLVVLASSSAARAFAALGSDVPAVSIGPQTTRTAEAEGVRIAAEARTHDLDGLVAAVEEACSSRS